MKVLAILSALGLTVASVNGNDCSAGTYAGLFRFGNGPGCLDTGFAFPGQGTSDTTFPTGDRLKAVCANDRCLALFAQLNAAFPSECTIGSVPLRSYYLDKFAVACAPAELNGPCGNEQEGAKRCSGGQYCQPWNPTSYQCRSIDAKCGVQEVGVDYVGDDLATVQVVLPEDCCTKCAATSGCTGYTFVNYNADNKAYCYLKKGPGKKTSKVGAVSATIIKSPTCDVQTPAKCTRQLTNVDLYGGDITSVTGLTVGDCCERCAVTPGCKAYTYVATNTACYLKSGSTDLRTSVGVVSGLLN